MKNYKKIIIGVILIWIIVFVTRVSNIIYDYNNSEPFYLSIELPAFNGMFTKYEGENVSGSQVNALLKTAFQSNMQRRAEALIPGKDYKFVSINGNAGISLNIHETSLANKQQADTSKLYRVRLEYDNKWGYVSNIIVDENE